MAKPKAFRNLDQTYVRMLFFYAPITGVLSWRVDRLRSKAGSPAGRTIMRNGVPLSYVWVDDAIYPVSHVVWLYVYGDAPAGRIIHLDGDGLNTRIANLRDAASLDKIVPELTQARLKSMLLYEPDTGKFWWLVGRGRGRSEYMKGQEAGFITKGERHRIKIDEKPYFAHRLAWLYVYGCWPSKDLDHINGDPADNRICNLREASNTDNHANSKDYRNNTSGHKGVYWMPKAQKWLALIQRDKYRRRLGLFVRKDDAIAAYRKASRELFGEFSRF